MSTTFAQFVQQNRQKQQSDPSYSVPFGLQQTEQPVDETAAANMAALQQEQGSSGIVDNLKNAGGGLYGAVSSFLDLGNKYVTRPGMGALHKLAAEHGIPIGWGNDDPEILEAIKNAESYTDAFNARFAENPWSRILVEMVADPINLTGVGLVGKAGKLNAVRKATEASPGLARAMRQAEGIDELSGRIQALPVTAAVGAGRRVARPIDRRLGPLLGRESLLSPSKGTQLRRGDSAADIVGTEQADEALRTARNLGDDVSQFQPPPPPTPPAGATPQGGTPPAPTSPATSTQPQQPLIPGLQNAAQSSSTTSYRSVDEVADTLSDASNTAYRRLRNRQSYWEWRSPFIRMNSVQLQDELNHIRRSPYADDRHAQTVQQELEKLLTERNVDHAVPGYRNTNDRDLGIGLNPQADNLFRSYLYEKPLTKKQKEAGRFRLGDQAFKHDLLGERMLRMSDEGLIAARQSLQQVYDSGRKSAELRTLIRRIDDELASPQRADFRARLENPDTQIPAAAVAEDAVQQTLVTSTVDDVVEEVSTTPPVTSAVDDVVDEVVDTAPAPTVEGNVPPEPLRFDEDVADVPTTQQTDSTGYGTRRQQRESQAVRDITEVPNPPGGVLDEMSFPNDLPSEGLERAPGQAIWGNANDTPTTYASLKQQWTGGDKQIFRRTWLMGQRNATKVYQMAHDRNARVLELIESDPVAQRLKQRFEEAAEARGGKLTTHDMRTILDDPEFSVEDLRRLQALNEEARFSHATAWNLEQSAGKQVVADPTRKNYSLPERTTTTFFKQSWRDRFDDEVASILNERVMRESGSQVAEGAGRQVDEVVDGVVPPPSGDLPPISGGQSTTPSGTPQTQAPPPIISNLSVDATVKDAVAQIAGVQNVAQSRAATEVASMITRQAKNNPEWFQALELTDNPVLRGHIEAALNATDTATRELHISNLLKEMGDIGGSFGVVVPRAVKWVYDLVPAAKGRQPKKRLHLTPDDLSTGLAPRHRQALERLFADENVQKFQQRYDQFRDIVTDIGNSVPGGRQINDMSTVEDLVYNMNLITDPKQKKIVEDFLKTFDLPTDTNLVQIYDGGVMAAYERSLMKQLGIKYPSQEVNTVTRRFARWIPKAWREQALLSPRYHLQNGLDMALKSQFYGVNWTKSAKAAPKFLENLGLTEYPRGVDVVSDHAEFATPDEPTALGAIPVAGRVGGWLARNNRHISRWMDNSARRAAWAQQTRDSLTQGMPRIQTRLRELGRQSNLQVNDLLSDLKNMGVEFSPQQMYEVAFNRTGSEEFATQARNLWAQTVQAASDQGVELATKIHYDYAYETVLEEALQVRHWVGFHIWATRNIPFYLDTLATHPMALRIWEDWYSTSKQEIEDSNLTSRFDNTLPLTIPILGPILSSIMGPGQTYFNPLVIMSLADQFDPRFEQQNPSTLASIFKYTGMAGISPAPWIQYPLSATGLLGDSTSAPRLGRHTGLIEGATGVNIEKPIQDFHDEVLERMGGDPKRPITNDPYTDYLVLKRIQEMSVEQTGVPNHPQYVQAMSDLESPIFQEALQQAQRTKLGGALYNFISPVPMKHLPTTEAAVRQRESELPPFEERDLESLPDNDLSTTYWGRPQSQLEAQIRAEMSQRRQSGTTSSRNAPFWLQARTQENETPLTDAFYQWWRTYGTQYETQSEALRAYTDFMARVGLN